MIAMSPVTPARIAASVPCPPSSSEGDEGDDQLAVEAARARRLDRAPGPRRGSRPRRPSCRTAPRPYSAPSRISAPHGSTVHVAGSPGGTTSSVPDKTSRRPARPAQPADDHGQRRPRHLLARPVRVGRGNRPRVGARSRSTRSPMSRSSSAAQVLTAPSSPVTLGIRTRRVRSTAVRAGSTASAARRAAADRSACRMRSATQDRPGHARSARRSR